MNLNDSSAYLYAGSDMHDGFIAGFLAAMRVYKHPVPVAGEPNEIARWIEATCVAYELESDRQHRARVRKILEQGHYEASDFRAMLLNCEYVDTYGKETYATGEPLRSEDDHREWPYCYGSSPNKVRFLEVADSNGRTLFEIRSDDCVAIEEALKLDIAIGDPVNELYREEACIGGKLEDYQKMVWQELKKLQPLPSQEPTCRVTEMEPISEDERDLWRLLTAFDSLSREFVQRYGNICHYHKLKEHLRTAKRADQAWQTANREFLVWLTEQITNYVNSGNGARLTDEQLQMLYDIRKRLNMTT